MNGRAGASFDTARGVLERGVRCVGSRSSAEIDLAFGCGSSLWLCFDRPLVRLVDATDAARFQGAAVGDLPDRRPALRRTSPSVW